MRWIALAISALLIGGCVAPQKVPEERLASEPCAKVARSRMNDWRINGADTTIQQIAFRGSYADCVVWEAKGFEPAMP